MNNDNVNIDLSDLQEIMNEIGEVPVGSDKRKNTLTPADVLIIAKIVQAVSHKSCAMGLTKEEISVVKRVIGTMNKGMLVVGYTILSAIGAGIVSLVWWGVKHGIVEVANKGVK